MVAITMPKGHKNRWKVFLKIEKFFSYSIDVFNMRLLVIKIDKCERYMCIYIYIHNNEKQYLL